MATSVQDEQRGVMESGENLKCAVCLELYERPRLLPCFHTVCLNCLIQLARPIVSAEEREHSSGTPTISEDTGKVHSSFACPTCRKVVYPPPGGVEQFQRNFKLEAAVALFRSSVLLCEMCDNSTPAANACVECQQWLCVPCQRFHDKVAGTKYHNLISLEPNETREEGRRARKAFCKSHKNEELVLHCCPCDVIICVVCTETTHQGHSTENIDVATEKIRAEIRDLLNKLEVNAKGTEEVISEVTRAEQELERQRQAVVSEAVEAAGKVSMWANQAEGSLVKEVNELAAPVKVTLVTHKKAACEFKTTLLCLQDRANRVIATGTYSMLQSLKSDLKRGLADDESHQQGPFQGPVIAKELKDELLKVKEANIFTRTSSGQEALQSVVPRFIGKVESGKRGGDTGKTTAFVINLGVDHVCVDPSAERFVVLKKVQKRKPVDTVRIPTRKRYSMTATYTTYILRMYDLNGSVVEDIPFPETIQNRNRMETVTVCEKHSHLGDKLVFVLNMGWLCHLNGPDFLSIDGDGRIALLSLPTKGAQTFIPFLARSSLGCKAHIISCDVTNVCEIYKVTSEPDGDLDCKPLFQVVHPLLLFETDRTLSDLAYTGFDVSEDEQYFAILEGLPDKPNTENISDLHIRLEVYRKDEAGPYATFNKSLGLYGYRPDFKIHLCFARYRGREMLLVSVREENAVYVLDHRKDCAIANKIHVTRPAFLARDSKERIWVCADMDKKEQRMNYSNARIIVFQP